MKKHYLSKMEKEFTEDNVMNKWDHGNLKRQLLRGIYSYGFENPSAIQKRAIPAMLKNNREKKRDLIAQAQSGTGKTGAFCTGSLEIVDQTINQTQVLILAPTHELASQSLNVINSLGQFLKIPTQLLVGGTSVENDKKILEEKIPRIVVGTPGRVQDMIRRKYLNINNLTLLVVDEADEMLSSGFKDQMYKIFQYIPNEVQIALFSATMPKELEALTSKFMRNPVKILVKTSELTLQGIAQYYINLENDGQKYDTLKDLFATLNVSQAIIYCNSVKRVDDLEEAMRLDEFPVKKIHGKMSEKERKDTYKSFKSGGCRVLITSNLFARGIDVQQVSIVINFDIPKNENTYLHRIGRSGRWGRKGLAINFQTKYDVSKLKFFEEYYSTEIKELPANYAEQINQ